MNGDVLTEEQKDIWSNLFNHTYSNENKIELLSYLEQRTYNSPEGWRSSLLAQMLFEDYPKYYLGFGEPAVFLLIKDLGLL